MSLSHCEHVASVDVKQPQPSLPKSRGFHSNRFAASQTLLNRCEGLDPEDRAIIEAVFGRGHTAADLARLRGERPAVIRRRVRRLVERLLSREFEFVLGKRDNWTSLRRRIASACFLRGRSIRQAAEELNLSFYTTRRHHDAVVALLEQEGA
jgi:hypothetical protein